MGIKQQLARVQLNQHTGDPPDITLLVPTGVLEHHFRRPVLTRVDDARVVLVVPGRLRIIKGCTPPKSTIFI